MPATRTAAKKKAVTRSPQIPSPDLRPHGNALTERIRGLFNAESVDPVQAGMFLRATRAGLQGMVLEISRDPSLPYEEKGRIMTTIAMIDDSIEAAFQSITARPKPIGMPALKRS